MSMVSHVQFGDVTGYVSEYHHPVDFDFTLDSNVQTFAHYALRSIQLDLIDYELEDALKEGPIIFNEGSSTQCAKYIKFKYRRRQIMKTYDIVEKR